VLSNSLLLKIANAQIPHERGAPIASDQFKWPKAGPGWL